VTSNALAASPTFTRTLALGAATVDANAGRAELAIAKVAGVTTVYVASGETPGRSRWRMQHRRHFAALG
jgi:hypothetical protein